MDRNKKNSHTCENAVASLITIFTLLDYGLLVKLIRLRLRPSGSIVLSFENKRKWEKIGEQGHDQDKTAWGKQGKCGKQETWENRRNIHVRDIMWGLTWHTNPVFETS